MLFMVIEKNKDAKAVYKRFREKGRMMPKGVTYIASWTELSVILSMSSFLAETISIGTSLTFLICLQISKPSILGSITSIIIRL